MKIVFLNTWDGKQKTEILEFFKHHAPSTDIFCLQEVYDDMRALIQEYLSDFNEEHVYQYGFKTETGTEDWAQATYIRKTLPVLRSVTQFKGETPSGLGISTEIQYKGGVLHILNYHGISQPKNKLDSEERIHQSKDILSYYADKKGSKILGGDFNFLPETEAYRTLSEGGYRELVQEYKVPTTRNHLYWDNRPQKHLFSDYIFVSKDVDVKGLLVPEVEVSDHLPLILEIGVDF